MKSLRLILLICFSILLVLFYSILIVYFSKFTGGISDKTDNWLLFISICNWGFISLLTALNIWVFYKLTTLIAQNESVQFKETKIAQTEDAILQLRIDAYKQLKQKADKVRTEILEEKNYIFSLKGYYSDLLFLNSSLLFATLDLKTSMLTPVIDTLNQFLGNKDQQSQELLRIIDRSLQIVEMLIFTNKLRDTRLLEEIRKNPNKYDSTIIGVDNFMNKL